MALNLSKYLPKYLQSNKWSSFVNVVSTVLDDFKTEEIETFLDHLIKETASEDDFKSLIIHQFGYPLNINFDYSYDFLRRTALTIVNRIRTKTTIEAYDQLFYALKVNGFIYPLYEDGTDMIPIDIYYVEDGSAEETATKDLIRDAEVSLVDTGKILTKHFEAKIAPKYVDEFTTNYFLTRPLHHYLMNDLTGSTEIVDSGTEPIFGTVSGTPTFEDATTPIATGTAIDFNGLGYVDTNYFSTTSNRSVAFWAKVNGIPADEVIYGSKDGSGKKFYFGFIDAVTFGLAFGTSNDFGSSPLNIDITGTNINNWNHYVVTYSNLLGKITLYVNGVDVGNVIADIDISSFDYFIGALNNNGSPTNYFAGVLDDVRVYDYIINSETLSDIYNSGAGREDHVQKTGDLKQFFNENLLGVIQYEIEQIKELVEVPRFYTYMLLQGTNDSVLQTYDLFDIDGNNIDPPSTVKIETITTQGWQNISSEIFLDDNNELDEAVPWTLDQGTTNLLASVQTVKIGQALGVTVNDEMADLIQPVYSETVPTIRKVETVDAYIIDVNLGDTPNINWITEIGLFDTLGNLLWYAKIPRLNKTSEYRYAFKITISK
jgi:hypothetical protein